VGIKDRIEPRKREKREGIKISEGLKLRLISGFDFTAIFGNIGANLKSKFNN